MSGQQYVPQDSESESDATSEASASLSSTAPSSPSSSVSTSPELGAIQAPNFRAFAEQLNLSGPQLTDISGQLNLMASGLLNPIDSGGQATFSNLQVTPDPSGVILKSGAQSITSIIMLDSRNRDRSIQVQPTDVTLRLPRVQSKVTNFQLVQIKLLSSFFQFRDDKHNTDITILEKDRTKVLPNGQVVPNPIKTKIRPGTQNINDLLTELTTQLNVTPIFQDYPNGFSDFVPRFAATGDFSLNFNQPGDTFYDSLQDQFIPNPTMALIISKQFLTQQAGLSSQNSDQLKIAQYYPVLKETLLDADQAPLVNLDISNSVQQLQPSETVRTRCVQTFQGLDDPVILEVINLNLTLLDTYRVNHTFRFTLINKQAVSYQAQDNRVTISSASLNTSLFNLLTLRKAQQFAEQLNLYGITQQDYDTLNTTNSLTLAVLNDLYQYLQKYLALQYGINFNSQTLGYLATPSNTIGIRDAIDASGISFQFDAALLQKNITPISNDVLSFYRDPPLYQWNRLSNLPQSTQPFPQNLETGNPATSSNYPQDLYTDQQNRNVSFVDLSGQIQNNRLTRQADIVVPIEATKQTTFRFKSAVRQTIQVETLPRPTKQRYPAQNAVTQDLSHQVLFDNSYSFVENAQNAAMDVTPTFAVDSLRNVPGFDALGPTTTNFGITQAQSIALWGSNTFSMFVGNTRAFQTFRTPYPTDQLTNPAPGYRQPVSVTLTHIQDITNNSPTFLSPFQIYLQHDRAAFMADVSSNRMESSFNQEMSGTALTDMSSVTLTMNLQANQVQQILIRSATTIFPTEILRVSCWFPNGTSQTALTDSLVGFDPLADPTSQLNNFNQAKQADPAQIRLPIDSNLFPNSSQDSNQNPLTFKLQPLGQDVSGVSSDLTNQVGQEQGVPQSNFAPNTNIRIDPISGQIFQFGSSQNTTTQSQFYSNSQNTILTSNAGGIYTLKSISNRDLSIAHYQNTTYLANSENQPPVLSNQISLSNFCSPFLSNSVLNSADLSGYRFGGSNQTLQFGDGINALSFTPTQGVWDIQRIMFRSAQTTSNPAVDGNRSIAYLGIQQASVTTNQQVHEIQLSDAFAVMKFNTAITQNSNTSNFGFDAVGGTYQEFVRDSNYRTGSNSQLQGYSQIRQQFNPDPGATQCQFPFDANGKMLTFQNITGSIVPYPFYSDASANLTQFDGNSPQNHKGLIRPTIKGSPSRGPPAGQDETQSQQALSMPIGTTLVQSINPYPIQDLSSAFHVWSSLPFTPTQLVTDVSGQILAQGTDFAVQSQTSGTSNSTFQDRFHFTIDQVVPSHPDVTYLGVAANDTKQAFFSQSNIFPSPPYTTFPAQKLILRELDPVTGNITELSPITSPYRFETVNLTGLTYNNLGGQTMGIRQTDGTSIAFCQHSAGDLLGASPPKYTVLSNIVIDPAIQQQTVRQNPKEETGGMYVFPQRTGLAGPFVTQGINDQVVVTPSVTQNTPATSPQVARSTQAGSLGPVKMVRQNLNKVAAPNIFTMPIVMRAPWKNRVFLRSEQDTQRLQEVTSYSPPTTNAFTSNANVTRGEYIFPAAANSLGTGANGEIWWRTGPTLTGNRNDTVDAPRRSEQNWQIFYPTQRIVLRQIAKNFSFLSDLSGLQYPEYPHTQMQAQNSLSRLIADTNQKWGLESSGNFLVGDANFSGQYFNSQIFSVPVQPTTITTPYQYLTVRNYTPTEKSQVYLRVSAPNRYDFGQVTLTDISNEIPLISTASNLFEPTQASSLQSFNSNFIFDSNGRVFGSNVIPGQNGSNFSNVTGFGDFYGRFAALQNKYQLDVQLVAKINAGTTSNLNQFVLTDLQQIFPPSALTRQRITDPLVQSILFRSALLPEYLRAEDEWGLGWNLGQAKRDTAQETVHIAESFFKILDDFINLRLNDEQDMNRMDTDGKENLSQTLESRGATRAFHSKLLLAPFGSQAQTMISNPITFYPPLGRIDKLTFQWVDRFSQILDNADCEWNAVVQIVEQRDMTTQDQPPLIAPR